MVRISNEGAIFCAVWIGSNVVFDVLRAGLRDWAVVTEVNGESVSILLAAVRSRLSCPTGNFDR